MNTDNIKAWIDTITDNREHHIMYRIFTLYWDAEQMGTDAYQKAQNLKGLLWGTFGILSKESKDILMAEEEMRLILIGMKLIPLAG